jgi:CBS-domain-containing membrane protein
VTLSAEPCEPPDRPEVLEPRLVRGLLRQLQLQTLLGRLPERPLWAAFMFINGFVTIALLAALAMVTGSPFVFPSLGPTAFLFFTAPALPTASPRNAVLGHAIGLVCGYAPLWALGLEAAGPATAIGVDAKRVLCAALSLAATGAVMVLAKAPHPPAGATTLIVALGIVTKPAHLGIIELAVVLLTLQAIALNRLAGLDYPLWSKR